MVSCITDVVLAQKNGRVLADVAEENYPDLRVVLRRGLQQCDCVPCRLGPRGYSHHQAFHLPGCAVQVATRSIADDRKCSAIAGLTLLSPRAQRPRHTPWRPDPLMHRAPSR